MKFGIRKPSFKKSWGARTSFKRAFMPRMPKGYGFLRNPKKALYNKIYNKTTISVFDLFKRSKSNFTSSYLEEQKSEIRNNVVYNNECPKCSICEKVYDVNVELPKVNLIIFIIGLLIGYWVHFIIVLAFILIIYNLVTTKKNRFYCVRCKFYWLKEIKKNIIANTQINDAIITTSKRSTSINKPKELKINIEPVYIRADFKEVENLDPMFIDAALLVIKNKRCNPRLLEKEMGLFYNRAVYVINELEKNGVVGKLYKKQKDVLYTESRPVILNNEVQLYELLYHKAF